MPEEDAALWGLARIVHNMDAGEITQNHVRLGADVERELIARAQSGDAGAAESLVLELTPFVRWIAQRNETPAAPVGQPRGSPAVPTSSANFPTTAP